MMAPRYVENSVVFSNCDTAKEHYTAYFVTFLYFLLVIFLILSSAVCSMIKDLMILHCYESN